VVNLSGYICLTVVCDDYILYAYCESIFIFILIVDKALLDDDYLDQRTLPLWKIILRAEHKERLAVSIIKYNYCVTVLAIDISIFGSMG
jgi:hypothetical protein